MNKQSANVLCILPARYKVVISSSASTRCPLSPCTQEIIRLNYRLRMQAQVTGIGYEGSGQLASEVGHIVWTTGGTVKQCPWILGHLKPLDIEDGVEDVATFRSCAPMQLSRELDLSDSEKANDPADSSEAQFQPVNDLSDSAVTEMLSEATRQHVSWN
jgi:hypothetical protein